MRVSLTSRGLAAAAALAALACVPAGLAPAPAPASAGNDAPPAPRDVRLDGVPRALSIATPDAATCDVTLADGRTLRLALGGGPLAPVPVAATPWRLPDGTAVALEGGDLRVGVDGSAGTVRLAAPPHAELAPFEGGVVLVAEATERYAHGVLGDATEAGALVLVRPGPPAAEAWRARPEGPQAVFEGHRPVTGPLGARGEPRVVVAESDEATGARLVAFDARGTRTAVSAAIGQGRRWRHALAIAPFGPAGEVELAAVRTPHLAARVEFYREAAGRLALVAALDGPTSHMIGSSQLGMAAAWPGAPARLVLPEPGFTALALVRRTATGAQRDGTLSLPARLSTNLLIVPGPAGPWLVAGCEDGQVRIFAAGDLPAGRP